MSKATVDTITITVGTHKLTITLAEANALRETLNDTLGRKEVVFPYIPPQKEYIPVSPSPFWKDNGPICISDGPHRLKSTTTIF